MEAPVSLRGSFWHNSFTAHLSPLVPDQSDDHAVEVEEEHKQVETKLDERLLLVHVKLPEDLRGVKQVLVLEDPVRETISECSIANCKSWLLHCFDKAKRHSQIRLYVLLCVPCKEGQVENERHPVAVDQEQDGQESVDTSLGDDVHVETVAQVDRVDVVAFQVRVHDGEEHLQEEVDGIDQDSKEEQPRQVLAAAKVAWVYRSLRTKLLQSFWRC